MEERDAGSKKETAPTDVGHLCAAPSFMPLLPPPAPQTPAKATERRPSSGEQAWLLLMCGELCAGCRGLMIRMAPAAGLWWDCWVHRLPAGRPFQGHGWTPFPGAWLCRALLHRQQWETSCV